MTDTSTTTASSLSPDTAATAPLAPSVAKVLAALHRLGEATAAGTAAEAGLGYSTTTPKLRALEDHGLAEPIRAGDGRTLWRLTDAGHTHARHDQEQVDGPGPAGPQPAAGSSAAEATDPVIPVAPHDGRHQVTDDTSGHLDDKPARAGLPGHTAAGADQPAASRCPAGTDRDPATTTAQADPADDDAPQGHTAEPAPSDEPDAASGTQAAATPAAHAPQSGGVTCDTGTGGGRPATAPADAAAAQLGGRRATGALRGAVLDILRAHPGQRYKTGELCRLIDQANEGTGASKASAGAVHNAAVKLVETGHAVQPVDRPATFALADAASPTT